MNLDHLAELAKIDLRDAKKKDLEKSLFEVVEYVSLLQRVKTEEQAAPHLSPHRNIFRDDREPYEAGQWSEEIIKEIPNTDGPYLKVKKVIEK